MKPIKTWIIGLAAVGVAVITVVFWLQINALDRELASQQGDTIVSLELAFTPKCAADMIGAWKNYGLIRTARNSIHWDWGLIAAYFALMMILRKWILRVKDTTSPKWAIPWLFRLPIVIAGLDVMENIGLYILLGLSNPDGFVFSITAPIVGMISALKFLLLFFFVVVAWRTMRINLKVLFLPRFSLLMLAVGVITIFVPQWKEALIAAAEDGGFWVSFWLGTTTLIASVTTWYSARVLYTLKLFDPDVKSSASKRSITQFQKIGNDVKQILKPSDITSAVAATEKDTAPVLKTWYPRVLGLLVPFIVIGGYCIALDGEFSTISGLPLLFLLLAFILSAGFIIFRRPISTFLYNKFADLWIHVKEGENHSDPWLEKNRSPENEFGKYNGLLDPNLPWFTKRVLLVLLLLNIAAFFSILYDPLWVQGAGSAAVVIGAVGLMVPTGNWLVYIGERKGIPLLLLLIGLAGLFSFHNDNHWVRLHPEGASSDSTQTPGPLPTAKGIYSNLESYATAWAATRKEAGDVSADIPLFIVSTEGGGIRAAYWTAIVLANLQDQNERFADHLFAISGVSGGSLGGTVFAAQIACGIPPNAGSYLNHADAVLKNDFLSPTVAALLFPDLVQRLLPWAVFDDRAIAMEKSWEKAWEDTWSGDKKGNHDIQRNFFKNPFDQFRIEMSVEAITKWVPLMFLNSTVVETGSRLIIHPLTFDSLANGTALGKSKETFSDVFKDAIDGHAALGSTVPVSTAVHLSARFTYVSPAGSVQNELSKRTKSANRNHRWIRLVDGGYFENSATITARELLNALEQYKEGVPPNHPLARILPFMIHISNEPIQYPKDLESKQRGKQAPFGEILSPLFALMQTRPARGFQAREDLFNRCKSNHAHFCLYDFGTTLPLGWALSMKARENMKAQLNSRDNSDHYTFKEKFHRNVEEKDDLQKWIEEAKRHNCLETEKVLTHLN